MNKKKVIVCTSMFVVIVVGAFIGSVFLKTVFGFSLYDIIAPTICALWISECAKKFYKWLQND